MARRLCQTLFALALVYAGVLGVFALLAYRGPRPDVMTMVRDFHHFVVGRGGPATATPEPGEIPPAVPPAPTLPPPPTLPAERPSAPPPPPTESQAAPPPAPEPAPPALDTRAAARDRRVMELLIAVDRR